MNFVNDSKLYKWFVIVTFAVGVILGAVSFYSILYVEPKIAKLLDAGSAVPAAPENADEAAKKAAEQKVSEYFTDAYKLLRNPQIFARYEYFDSIGMPVKRTLSSFDTKVYNKEPFLREHRVYLNILLERRELGSRLGRNTMLFFFAASLIGCGFWLFERRRARRAA